MKVSSFADAFNKWSSKSKVLHSASCLESHQDDGDCYHRVVKLSGSKCWKAVKDTVNKENGNQ